MISHDAILDLLNGNNYTMLNHKLLISLGGDLSQAFMLSHLIGMYGYFRDAKMINEDGWFFQTINDIEKNCGITASIQRRALTLLEQKGIIGTRLMGSPPKRHFKLLLNKIEQLIGVDIRITIPLPDKESKILSRTEFYDALNKAIGKSWTQTKIHKGNIPINMAYFMYRWSYEYHKDVGRDIGNDFVWTPKSYGIVRHWFRSSYTGKRYDYNKLLNFWKKDGDREIYSFIQYDREQVECSPPDKLIAERMIILDRAGNREEY